MRLADQSTLLKGKPALLAGAVGVAAFHAAYTFSWAGFLIVVFLGSVFALSWLGSPRAAFYSGLGVGLAAYGPQLAFFYDIFGAAALALWMILAFWLAAFVGLLCACRHRLGPVWAMALAPVLWMGLEFFRCELYPLRFSWLNVGYAFAESPQVFPLAGIGTYGLGFALMGLVGLVSLLPGRGRVCAALLLPALLGLVTNLPCGRTASADAGARSVRVAGVQMEFPAELEISPALSEALRDHPGTDLFVLSEYTFDGPVSDRVRQWCRKQQRHLIAGGKEPIRGDEFYNTAYVIDPEGRVAFRQAKSVPIQFFKDGRAAPEQRLWVSPWGRIGLPICYDLSYTRVMDRFVATGAQGLIVPTMDVAEWGAHEHALHARVGPMRAAEYGLPVFRVASSGVSQLIDGRGRVQASAAFLGDHAVLAGEMRLRPAGQVPLDRQVAWISTALTALLVACFALARLTNLPWRELPPHRRSFAGIAAGHSA